MDKKLSNKDPLNYIDWSNQLQGNVDRSQEAYFAYLIGWYNLNSKLYPLEENKEEIKPQYVQLVKDLIFLLDDKEKDMFLSQIDYNNNEDLIYIIPYLARKLKQISQVIVQKREELKKNKIKNQIKGSVSGVEKILYQYILKNFTNKDYSWTKIPIPEIASTFPQLSSINNDFYIEIEELYDTNNYYDSDSTVDIDEYLSIEDLITKEPFQNLSDDELSGLVKTRFLNKIAKTPLSKVYDEYLNVLTLSSFNINENNLNQYSISINNQIEANKKYLGETVFALTAIKNNEINQPDYVLNMSFENGSNLFYWPSGDKLSNFSSLKNVYRPIKINESNLILNRSVSGSSYLNSDLLFAEKGGVLEAAWLQGYREIYTKDKMIVNLKSYDTSQFIFPWVGFDLNSRDLTFKQYKLNDFGNITFQKLNEKIRENVLESYYSNNLPNSACDDVYLNQTSLVKFGANAGYYSDTSDTITVSPSSQIFKVWNEKNSGTIERAFLYKFDKTDIYVKNGINDIHWPLESYDSKVNNLSLSLSADTCLPIILKTINPNNSMAGAVAGTSFDNSDVIYKLKENGGQAIEAAWLGASSIINLDQTKNNIQIYNKPAEICAEYIEGPIQPSLYMKMDSGEFTSFVWMDEDTPADQVFKYRPHSPDCPYGKSFPHDFYENQIYQNISPLNNGKSFPLIKTPCTCRSVYNSPIGIEGESPKDYNGMSDLLFADPQGLGVNFDYNTWRDTRNYTYKESPQFAFFKLNGNQDKTVGFGEGTWITGNKTPMILKTGRRYTYYRNNFRITPESNIKKPYLFVNYKYKTINVRCNPDNQDLVDLVILVDSSRTQYYSLEDVKGLVKKCCEVILNSENKKVQISLISFNSKGILMNYLTNDLDSLLSEINDIQIPPDYPDWFTNIADGLILSNRVLNTTNPQNNLCNFGDTTNLCRDLVNQIVNTSKLPKITNCPRANAAKRILIFSDGQETLNMGLADVYANLLKRNNIQIFSVDLGYFGLLNNVMENIASPNSYYNLQKYLFDTDFNVDKFIIDLANYVVGCFPATPLWCKAIKTPDGSWEGINEPSDMILNAGDYLAYDHRSNIRYITQRGSFNIPSLSFTINVKLDGWNYDTKNYNISAFGDYFGAKPFWGRTYFSNSSAFPIGGSERIMDEYVILKQPEVSNIILKNGYYITYKNQGDNLIRWEENLNFNAFYTDQEWKKLNINKDLSIFFDLLNTKKIDDYIIDGTNEKSDMALESYSSINPVKYIFYLAPQHTPFNYNENLFLLDRCGASYAIFLSGKAIIPTEPHKNLENRYYPTIANINFPSTFISNKHVGEYLLPNKLGVSFYVGTGYNITIDSLKTNELEENQIELLFLDPEKYGSRNRGLTKKDQASPVKINNVDNTWFMEPIGSGIAAGTTLNLRNNQSFTPYKTNYEINPDNQIGLNTQNENFKFWQFSFYDPFSKETDRYLFTNRNELILNNYFKYVDSLLTDIGIQTEWKTDIYGNDFGFFKGYGEETSDYILTENNLIIIAEFGFRLETE